MAKKISVISTHESLTKKIEDIIKEMNEDIDIYTAIFDDAAILCRDIMKKGTKIFISRGGNTRYLEKKLGCTVVDISHNLSDYIGALKKAKCAKGMVGIFSYEKKLDDIDAVGKLMNIDIKQYTFNNTKEAQEAVLIAKHDGIVLGIGGVVTGTIAKQMGIDYIVIDSSRSSIIDAIKSAKQLLKVQNTENKKAENYKIQMENYKAILNFSYNAIIAIDENSIIRAFNPIAEKLLGISATKAIGKRIRSIFPNTMLTGVLESGVAELNQIREVNNTILYTNRVPIIINGKVKGAVATLQDIKTIQENEQQIRRKLYDKGLIAKYNFSHIVGNSKIMQQTVNIAKSYSKTSSTILIQGESGTGKELFAQSIHNFSNRKEKPFVAINCAALPENLLESELFGYEDGAFTGARKGGKMGLFEVAHKGTIFLDEIAEIPPSLQAQLLRVLQEKEIRRLGSDKIIPVDVRIIAATNKDLEMELKEGRFREDLFYRINVLKLKLPPLRERKEDIVEIGISILNKKHYRDFVDNLPLWNNIMKQLAKYPWHGNIRELENVIERLTVVVGQNIINLKNYKDLINDLVDIDNEAINNTINKDRDDKQTIYEVLSKSNGCKTTAAEKLGISRTTLWRKMKKYNIGT